MRRLLRRAHDSAELHASSRKVKDFFRKLLENCQELCILLLLGFAVAKAVVAATLAVAEAVRAVLRGSGMSTAEDRLLRSPRANLHALIRQQLGDETSDAEMAPAVAMVQRADAENKLGRKKLYLVLDLDETLVYSQRLAPGAKPRGSHIIVHGEPFDMVLRPGLQHFLAMAGQTFILYMYTMGDEAYVKAVLEVIDPQNTLFTGAPSRTRAARAVGVADRTVVRCWSIRVNRVHRGSRRSERTISVERGKRVCVLLGGCGGSICGGSRRMAVHACGCGRQLVTLAVARGSSRTARAQPALSPARSEALSRPSSHTGIATL